MKDIAEPIGLILFVLGLVSTTVVILSILISMILDGIRDRGKYDDRGHRYFPPMP